MKCINEVIFYLSVTHLLQKLYIIILVNMELRNLNAKGCDLRVVECKQNSSILVA